MKDDDSYKRRPRQASYRRRFLRSVGTIGTIGLIGCVQNRDSNSDTSENTSTNGQSSKSLPESELIAYNPYEGVDWETVDRHKSQFHNHVRGRMDEPADIADLYQDRGYTVYAVADKGYNPIAWPWTEFSELDDEYKEDRDPEAMGVVAFPGCEFTISEHVGSIFSTLNHETADLDDRDDETDLPDDTIDVLRAIVDREDHYVPEENGGLAILNHPDQYYDDPDDDWDRYQPYFDTFTREQGFLGLEAFNQQATENEDIDLWDNLLTEYAPDHLIWGFGTDDPREEYAVGNRVDIRWTTVLLDETGFNPSDQHGSRVAAAAAFREGRTLCHQRESWDNDTEEPVPVPQVNTIEIDAVAEEITIDATDYDTFEWVNNGKVVSTDETLSLTSDHVPYVRAHLSNDAGGETSTQPFGIDPIEPV